MTTPDENRPSWQPPDERNMRHWDESRERDASWRGMERDAPRGYGYDEGDRPRFVQHPGYHGGSAYGRTEGGYGSYGGQQGFSGQHGGYAPAPRTGGHRGKGPWNFTRSDERIKEHVSELLTEHDEIDATNLEVQVKNGEVTLTGTVDDRHQRRLVEDVVEGIAGIGDVHMSIKLGGDRGGRAIGPAIEGNGDPNKPRA